MTRHDLKAPSRLFFAFVLILFYILVLIMPVRPLSSSGFIISPVYFMQLPLKYFNSSENANGITPE